jgi:AraC-like DNA-binding protein/mannose-6-phosphate isomerase-like protein (cupin superfamily)
MAESIYVEGSRILNHVVSQVAGSQLAFNVFYWGGVDKHYDNTLHKHSFFEVCYVLSGSGIYLEDDFELPLKSGSLFLSRPNVQHQIRSKDGLGLIFVAFETVDSGKKDAESTLFDRMTSTKNTFLNHADESSSVLIWKALILESMRLEPLFDERINGLACALLASFEQTFADRQPAPPPKLSHHNSGIILYQAKLIIRDNLSTPLRLDEVAKLMHISGRHLSRVFHQELDKSFTEYVRQERIQRAVALLTTTNLPLKEVAEATGFVNIYYFTKVFTSEMGLPPGQFRKKLADG